LAKVSVVRAEPVEDGTPQEILDVAVDRRAVRQFEAEPSTV